MADATPDRVSALAPAGVPAIWRGDGLAIEERPGLGHIVFRGRREATVLDAAARVLNFALPSAGAVAEATGIAALGIADDEWLLVVAAEREGDLVDALAEATAGRHAALVTVGHGTVTIRVSGPRARDCLAKGASLDLHVRSFGPGRCAATGFGRVRVILQQVDASPAFDLHVNRSFALGFWGWLSDAALEWSGTVGA
jgi:sarcosine oxidase subunit gamma